MKAVTALRWWVLGGKHGAEIDGDHRRLPKAIVVARAKCRRPGIQHAGRPFLGMAGSSIIVPLLSWLKKATGLDSCWPATRPWLAAIRRY